MVTIMTRHHIRPKRHYGKVGNHMIVRLCRACHNALELMIPYKKMCDTFYFEVLYTFFGTTNIPIEGRYRDVKDKPSRQPPPRRKSRRTFLRPSWQKCSHKHVLAVY